MGTVNGAIFLSPPTEVSGTGLIDSFVRMQGNGTESGYNTDGDLEFDTKAGLWTHSLQLSAVQTNIVQVSGIDYYEFVLDVNEVDNKGLITLHGLEFYIDALPNRTGYPNIGNLVYDLDAGEDSRIELDYSNFPGSGKLDMIALVPISLFGTDLSRYVYLYSEFGSPNPCEDGFEEWAHKKVGTFSSPPSDGSVPEPGTLILIGSGLTGLAGYCKFKFGRRKK